MSIFTQKLGQKGEELACSFLKKNGYSILQRNYRKRCGEIDIIAQENGDLVFIEIKTRSGDELGSATSAVTTRKQKQIIKTAINYLSESNCYDIACRFDVLGITILPGTHPVFELIQGAFELS